MRWVAAVAAALTIVVLIVPGGHAAVWPTSMEARAWKAPHGFISQALCVRRFESPGRNGWHRAWVTWDGHRSSYAGGMQFTLGTWRRAGGLGEPWQWSPREQVFRAWRIWKLNGGSWREWGTRARCGLS